MAKQGTPTMGGLLILAAILIPTFLLAKLDNIYILTMLLATVWIGSDWIRRRLHQSIQEKQRRPSRTVQGVVKLELD